MDHTTGAPGAREAHYGCARAGVARVDGGRAGRVPRVPRAARAARDARDPKSHDHDGRAPVGLVLHDVLSC